MLAALRFVRGAVSTKEMIPVLTAFHIYDGRIQGMNGRLTIDCPCPELAGMDITIHAETFLKAVDGCDGEPKLEIISEGKLKISRGGFKVVLPLLPHDSFPKQAQDGVEGVKIATGLLPSLRVLQPFMGEDASRPWACGMLFRNGMAYATNNSTLVGVEAYRFETDLNLPFYLIDELLRIGEEPGSAHSTGDSISFSFKSGAWIKSQLMALEWPGAVESMLQFDAVQDVIPSGLARAVEKLVPFCPDKKVPIIKFTPEGIQTMDGDKSACITEFSLPGGSFRAEPLITMLNAASHAQFAEYPARIPFSGPAGLRGIMMGVKI